MSAYKDTLNLPRTEFPMKAALPQREPEMLQRWEQQGLYFQIQQARKDAPLYILHDGPPFANGDVHMGTALNKVLKDFVIKSKTMAGFRAPFIPGWDCHGLPIEYKVVKEAAGLAPAEIRSRSEAYARQFIDVQRAQFKRLGVLGDWQHPYLTLEPAYEAAILRAFAGLLRKGLVYRGKKPVLWSYGARTALAEAEVEYKEKLSPSIYVRFRGVTGAAQNLDIAVWTTTPWTLPANLALAVHPTATYALAEFSTGQSLVVAEALVPALAEVLGATSWRIQRRWQGAELEGSRTRHPFLDRESPVFTADFVTMDTGTGIVHIAPGHGEEDCQLGLRHGLDLLSPVNDDGAFTPECGVPELVGKNVFTANPEVIALLRAREALLAEREYRHSYPHCWRSKTPVIFRAVEQFFIAIEPLRKQALDAIDQVQWIPHWGRNRIRGTVESRPDWCISRQRTWGVPLPVFCNAEGEPLLDAELAERVAEVIEQEGSNAWFSWTDEQWRSRLDLPAGHTRRMDTLDVWIDSGVSHLAVLETHPELRAPADLYLEATDQHRGWFQSSLMMSIALRGRAPYRAVLTHGFVVDMDTRRKISKSEQGGYQKPTNASYYVEKYGADLVRLWACSVNFTDDVPFSEEIFTRLSDAYRRIRNTLRILIANLHDAPQEPLAPHALTTVDRWILAELEAAGQACREAYETLEFHRVYQTLTQFCAVELSSLYIDITKDRLYCDRPASPRRRATQAAMREIAEHLCLWLAPILAFTAEEAWGYLRPGASVHTQLFPAPHPQRATDPARATLGQWLEWRALITQEIEKATKSGVISNPLEACVTLTLPEADFHAALPLHGELEEFFILSHLELRRGSAPAASVTRTPHKKCERCWRHRADVGSSPAHPGLCGRCEEAVSDLAAPRCG